MSRAQYHVRRGQMEMVGLVFVVLIVILGIVLYVSFSAKSGNPGARKEIQTYTSYLNAFGETEIPRCGLSVARVAEECALGDTSICSGEPCVALQEAMDTILGETLDVQNIKYNMSLGGTDVGRENQCPSGTMESGVYRSTLPVGTEALYLEICLR